MSTTPEPVVIFDEAAEYFEAVVAGTFTRKCQCGATVHIIDTVEQPHEHVRERIEVITQADPRLDLDSMRAHAVAAENPKAGAHVTNAELLALLNRVETAELWTVAHPCDISHEAPYDFKWCEAHDRTFPLDGDCDHKGKSALEWQDAREQEQRIRAIRAEERAEDGHQRLNIALARAARNHNRALAAETKVKAVRELAARLLPVTERDPHIGQDSEEAHDEGHTEGWNEALTELARLLDGGA